MKKSDFRGFKQVFNFTFSTTFKTRSFFITMIIMIILTSAVFPIMNYKNRKVDDSVVVEEDNSKDDQDDEDDFGYKKVYFINETNIADIDFEEFKATDEVFKKLEFVETDKSEDEIRELITSTEKDSIFLHITVDMEEGAYKFNFMRDEKASFDDADKLGSMITAWFVGYKTTILNLSDETVELLNTPIATTDMDTNEYLKEDTHDIISESEYNVVYAFLMIVYFIVIFSASYVANKVVEEKANRVVEFLMTSVRPMALIMGKVLAMLSVVMTELGLIILVGYISNKISASIFEIDAENSVMARFISLEAVEKMNAIYVIIALLILAIGIFAYSLLAGLFGASVSKMEDVSQGLLTFNIIIVVAFFIAMISANLMWAIGINGFVSFTLVFPLTSPFMLPGAILIGKASWLLIAIAFVLLVLTAIFMLKFVSLVYESVIVMNGEVITLKKMIKLAKERRKN